MSDIVERLRRCDVRDGFAVILKQHVDKAADEIDRLRAVSAELCEAMDDCISWLSSGFAPQSQTAALKRAARAKAEYRRALEPKP